MGVGSSVPYRFSGAQEDGGSVIFQGVSKAVLDTHIEPQDRGRDRAKDGKEVCMDEV